MSIDVGGGSSLILPECEGHSMSSPRETQKVTLRRCTIMHRSSDLEAEARENPANDDGIYSIVFLHKPFPQIGALIGKITWEVKS